MLEVAREAVSYVKKYNLTSTNMSDSGLSEQELNGLEAKYNQTYMDIAGRVPEFNEIKLASDVIVPALAAKACSIGNCQAQSALAFLYLAHSQVVPLELMSVGSDHVFVVIGRTKGKITNYTEWNQDAIICDAWSNNYYPANKLGDRVKKEPLATVTGGETKTVQMTELRSLSNWPKELDKYLQEFGSPA